MLSSTITDVFFYFFYFQLKMHVEVHNANRKLYECPREGCSRVYTRASLELGTMIFFYSVALKVA